MIRLFTCFMLLLLSMFGIVSAQRVSVIIPCTHKHFYLLPHLLDSLAAQTQIPDEVVISLSRAKLVDQGEFQTLQNRPYPFALRLISSNSLQYAGTNRNIAAKNSSGEILITQDADDLPHPQRVEMICYFLQKTGAVQLLHQWYPSEDMIDEMPKNQTLFLPKWVDHYENFDSLEYKLIKNGIERKSIPYLHNGNIGLLRHVLDVIQWSGDKKAQDIQFNIAVIEHFQNSYVLYAPLVIYRNRLSSHNPSN